MKFCVGWRQSRGHVLCVLARNITIKPHCCNLEATRCSSYHGFILMTFDIAPLWEKRLILYLHSTNRGFSVAHQCGWGTCTRKVTGLISGCGSLRQNWKQLRFLSLFLVCSLCASYLKHISPTQLNRLLLLIVKKCTVKSCHLGKVTGQYLVPLELK